MTPSSVAVSWFSTSQARNSAAVLKNRVSIKSDVTGALIWAKHDRVWAECLRLQRPWTSTIQAWERYPRVGYAGGRDSFRQWVPQLGRPCPTSSCTAASNRCVRSWRSSTGSHNYRNTRLDDDDLATIHRDVDRGDGRLSCAHNDRELMGAQPGGQPSGGSAQDEPGDLCRAGGMVNFASPRKVRIGSPLDEERKRRLGRGQINPGAPPLHLISSRRGPRPTMN